LIPGAARFALAPGYLLFAPSALFADSFTSKAFAQKVASELQRCVSGPLCLVFMSIIEPLAKRWLVEK
jgi:hypothetical protein